MNDRFRPQIIQSGLFALIRSAGVIFYSYGLFYSNACCQKSHLFRPLTFLWVGVSSTPPYGIKTKSIPEPKVRSRNQSFLVKRNRNRFHMTMLCWNRNRYQLQFFRAESESIPVSWNQAQVCTEYELTLQSSRGKTIKYTKVLSRRKYTS